MGVTNKVAKFDPRLSVKYIILYNLYSYKLLHVYLITSSTRPSIIFIASTGMQTGGISNVTSNSCTWRLGNNNNITQWWGIPFRVAEDEGSIAGINLQRMIVSWH